MPPLPAARSSLPTLLALLLACFAHAATATVTDPGDAGPGTLRQAIAHAASGDSIRFALPAGQETIVIASQLAIAGKSLAIDGANTRGSGVQVTITVQPGPSSYRVFDLQVPGGTTALSNLNLVGGSLGGSERGGVISCSGGTLFASGVSLGGGSAEEGGGLYVGNGTEAALAAVTASGNAAVFGGGLYLDSTAVVTCNACAFRANTAVAGGGVFAAGTLVMDGCTIAGNTVTSAGGGIFNQLGAVLRMYATTLDGNASDNSGGGVYNAGNAIILNATITGNACTGPGNGGGGIQSEGILLAMACTIAGNSASSAGGGFFGIGTTILVDDIVVGNAAPQGADLYRFSGSTGIYACWYHADDGSGTAVADATIAPNVTTAYAAGDLGALADHGGATATMALAPGAAAVDAGVRLHFRAGTGYYFLGLDGATHLVGDLGTHPTADPAEELSDQRGLARASGGPSSDIGAYEIDLRPTLLAVAIASSNADPARARPGDVITLGFTASTGLDTPSVTIAGHPAVVSGSGTSWQAAHAVTARDPHGTVAFSIAFAAAGGLAGATITATTDASAVVIPASASGGGGSSGCGAGGLGGVLLAGMCWCRVRRRRAG